MSSSLSILSVGAVTPLGRSLAEIARQLSLPASCSDEPRRVKDELLNDPDIARRLRRADRFSRMGVVAALDAWRSAAQFLTDIPMTQVGLIVASGLGPHCRGFRLLDGMLDNGDPAASPTDFSHSVHGTPAAYITELLSLRGPAISCTDFESGFSQALFQAQCWINQGICQRVLIGAIEELGDVMLHCVKRMVPPGVRVIPGEGAVFFVLAPREIPGVAQLMRAKPSLAGGSVISTISPEYFGQSASSNAFDLLGNMLLSPEKVLSPVAPSKGLEETALLVSKSPLTA